MEKVQEMRLPRQKEARLAYDPHFYLRLLQTSTESRAFWRVSKLSLQQVLGIPVSKTPLLFQRYYLKVVKK